MISQEEIKAFLEGNDPEEHIVAIEFDYLTDSIYKIKEIPGKGKEIRKDTFTPFAWVGDLRGLNFYQSSKGLQKEAMSKHGIMIEKLETKDNDRLEQGLKYMVKCLDNTDHINKIIASKITKKDNTIIFSTDEWYPEVIFNRILDEIIKKNHMPRINKHIRRQLYINSTDVTFTKRHWHIESKENMIYIIKNNLDL